MPIFEDENIDEITEKMKDSNFKLEHIRKIKRYAEIREKTINELLSLYQDSDYNKSEL